ncbi:hypothetical protein K4L06_15390 [Lysobacter sp. BMK333-48F3]|uniref:hypothetical protein n=1 Tax=Lysobacter sp. BMK333-48F3 TaxID=2867962 RepID=UPI001C8B637A|nr:hypothetical protein [Lysobacter sp. BMK333-48F3]MBX9402692.1 hypothetical protein [Lysobacter sp. BMK333-48F3]
MIRDERTCLRHSPGEVRRAVVDFVRASAVCVRAVRDGSLPLVGVNTFLPKDHGGDIVTEIELIRSTESEKGQQIAGAAVDNDRISADRRASATSITLPSCFLCS